MKRFKLIPVGAALALFVSVPAFAVTVSPAGPISLEGATTLVKSLIPLGCTANLVGSITSTGAVSITSAKFTGQALCSAVTAANLPWSGQVNSTTSLTLTGVAVNTPLGNCGPSALNASVAQNTTQRETTIGLVDQVLSGGCTVSGSLTTTPFLTVN
ncbi:hypothetical protein [Trinickia dinghuensis]|uniref:Protein activator of alkane oxidation PraB n=1 Tax=Trinickia dinghuensis TaxID=2291023 RepID=A0A3D8K535_9BURK|nr:hypothetical protein [Trinickia dinghuensis]RDV00544.1 hypothetical protein DWV00_01840 [Trinickia dinghuensis]